MLTERLKIDIETLTDFLVYILYNKINICISQVIFFIPNLFIYENSNLKMQFPCTSHKILQI